MEAQVQNAVEVALNPDAQYNLKQQAFEFISQVKESPDAWRLALALLTSQPIRPAPVRHFALQILDSAIKRSFYNDVSAFQQTKTVLLSLLDLQPANQQYFTLRDEPQYLHNQVAHSLTLLFVLSYTTTWPSFFDDCLTLTQKSASRGLAFEPFSTSIFLKALSMIDEEVADALYTSTKKAGDQRINTEIKDQIRAYDVRKISHFLFQVMTAFQSDTEQEELVRQCLVVIGQWVAWIDITLIVNDEYMTLIYRFLGHPELRTAASETLANIVSKKMSSGDKLEMITFLNLTQVVNSLDADQDVEFAEAMAGLVNAQGLELTRILLEANSSPTLGSKTVGALRELLPLLLRFLSNEYDDTSMAVFPFLTDLLSQSRRSAKKTGTDVIDRDFLQALLQALFKKMRYDDESVSPENEDSEEEAEFHDLRKRLLGFQESVAASNPDLYSQAVQNLVSGALRSLNSGTSNWRDMEVALVEMNAFADCLKGTLGRVDDEANLEAHGQWENSEYCAPFLEMLTQLVSLSSKLRNPSLRVLFMDIVVRYSSQLQLRADLIPPVLEFFVGAMGIQSNEARVQLRSWYLFERYLMKVQRNIAPMSDQILVAFTDLLQIRVITSSNPPIQAPDSDSDNESEHDVFFDSQLYLFQAAGLLIALMDATKLEVAEALLQSLIANINDKTRLATSDQTLVANIHHNIMAIGDIAKGYDGADDGSTMSRQSVGNRLFAPASEVILEALANFEDSSLIRDATRYAFARLVNVMGENILEKIPPLIGGLLRKSTTWELIDFLPFLGQLIHRFKPGIRNFLDELMLPLLSRIFESLNKAVEGTDDIIEQTSMRKAYLSFILNLFNNGMESIFVSEVNRSKFDAVLESIVHYATDTSEASVEKLAFGVLNKMVVVWSSPVNGAAAGNREALDSGFQDLFGQFVIEHLSRVCFEVPSKSTFNSNDAQSRLVLAEIAGLQKSIFQMKGDMLVSYLQNNIFPSMGVPPAAAQEYRSALQHLDLKQFKKYFVTFASR